MFCIICGQPIEELNENIIDTEGRIVAIRKHYYHTTASTYPQLNDHEPQPGG